MGIFGDQCEYVIVYYSGYLVFLYELEFNRFFWVDIEWFGELCWGRFQFVYCLLVKWFVVYVG